MLGHWQTPFPQVACNSRVAIATGAPSRAAGSKTSGLNSCVNLVGCGYLPAGATRSDRKTAQGRTGERLAGHNCSANPCNPRGHVSVLDSRDVGYVSFRTKLVLSLILLLIPLMASDSYFHYRLYVTSRSAALSKQMEAAVNMARATDVFVERIVAVQRAAGQALAEPHWRDPAVRQEYIESVLSSTGYLRQVAFADPAGTIIESAPRSILGVTVADQDYFRRIRNGADWTVSNLITTKLQSKPGFVVATGIRDHRGKLLGVTLSAVDETKMISELHAPCIPGTLFVLVDTKGQPVFTCDKAGIPLEDRQWQKDPFVRAALRGAAESTERFDVQGRPTMAGASPLRASVRRSRNAAQCPGNCAPACSMHDARSSITWSSSSLSNAISSVRASCSW